MSVSVVYFTMITVLQMLTGGRGCSTISGLPVYENHPANSIAGDQVQAIIPGYRFNCPGRVTGWGGCFSPVDPANRFHVIYQVWREEAPGCYQLIGPPLSAPVEDVSDLLRLRGGCNITKLSVENQILVEEGDVVGFYVDFWTSFAGVVFFNGNDRIAGFQVVSNETDIEYYYKRDSVSDLSSRYLIGSPVEKTLCDGSGQLHLTATGAPVITVVFEPLRSTDTLPHPTSTTTLIFSSSTSTTSATSTSSTSSSPSSSSSSSTTTSTSSSTPSSTPSSTSSSPSSSSSSSTTTSTTTSTSSSSTTTSTSSTSTSSYNNMQSTDTHQTSVSTPSQSLRLQPIATPTSSQSHSSTTSLTLLRNSSTTSSSTNSFPTSHTTAPSNDQSSNSLIISYSEPSNPVNYSSSPVIASDNESSLPANDKDFVGIAVAASILCVVVIFSIGSLFVIIFCLRARWRRQRKNRDCVTISSPELDNQPMNRRSRQHRESSNKDQPSTQSRDNRFSMISNLIYATSQVLGPTTSHLNNDRDTRANNNDGSTRYAEPAMVFNAAYAASNGHSSTPQSTNILEPPQHRTDPRRMDNEEYEYVF